MEAQKPTARRRAFLIQRQQSGLSAEFSSEVKRLGEEKKVALLKTEIKDAKSFVESLNPKPDMLLAATNNSMLNFQLVKAAKKIGCLVYAVDNPAVSDFILPAIAKVGDIKVAVSTGGKSPAMAHVLRERIEKVVTPQDLLEIELQANLREILKQRISDSRTRVKMLYAIINNVNVKKALCEGKLEEAQKLTMKLIENKENKP